MSKEEEKIIIPIPTDADTQEKFNKMAKHLDAWQKNDRPKWRAVKETRQLIDKFLNQPSDNAAISYDDILNSFIKTGDTTRTKIDKKNRTVTDDTGISYNTQKKYLNALKMYEKLVADGVSRPTAKGKVRKYNGWKSIKVTEKNLTIARKLLKS